METTKNFYFAVLTSVFISTFIAACKANKPQQADEKVASSAHQSLKSESKKAEPDKGPSPEKAAEESSKVASSAPSEPPDSPAMHPENATKVAPKKYAVKVETNRGDFFIDVHRDWAPLGADRFYNLVEMEFLTDIAFFRVIKGFMAQTGLSGNPAINRAWMAHPLEDDPVVKSNTRSMVSFATSGKNSRTTQFFINYDDNSRLDAMGFAPFGKVRNMKVLDKLYSEYGESFPRGHGPQQRRILMDGNRYLKADFPHLDYIQKATIVH